jgi:uncharacterized protein (DUF58 family)
MNTALIASSVPTTSSANPGVYAELGELVRLRAQARGFSFLPRQPVHSLLSGRHASRLRGRGLNFEEIRRYLPGDDIRTMDWHVTARTQKPHVRVYTEERDRPILLLVDQRAGMFFGSRRAMKSVIAAEAAALAAWRVLQAGDRVGAIVFNDTDTVVIKPERSETQVLRILDAIIAQNHALHAGASPTPAAIAARFNDILTRASRLASHDYLVCLITDAAGADESSVKPASQLVMHNDLVIVFVHDALEATLPSAGRLVMSDGDRQLEVDTSDRGLRDRFASAFSDRLERIRTLSRRRAIPVLPIDTEGNVATQFRQLIGAAIDARTKSAA